MSAAKTHRKLHRVGAILVLLPALVLFPTGVLLQLKKEVEWIQPPTQEGSAPGLEVTWDEVLEALRGVESAEVTSWDDVDRLDVRPGKGMVKVRCANRWEVQVDSHTGAVLQSSYRRSDLIESLHDGSWFHDRAKLLIWLPAGLILCGLWITGLYLWVLPYLVRRKRKQPKS
ncbi:MAG: PepSY-associated TM helix domain-containing protein [Planctomycetota bacterium]|nr:PepSY-associated TM helix domain-containing protein [Planctomycetota bacterium]